jgi:hypothetical protein
MKGGLTMSNSLIEAPGFIHRGHFVRVGDGIVIKLPGGRYQKAVLLSMPA